MASIDQLPAKHEVASTVTFPQTSIINKDIKPYALFMYFFIFLILLLIPVTSYQIPPLYDYPNHLARLYIIENINQNDYLSKFYRIEWQIIPNIAMDIIVTALSKAFGLFAAGKVFIFATVVLLFTGICAIHIAVYRGLSISPMVSAIIIYNQVFAYGLLNYMFGIAVALWGVAVWLMLRSKSPLLRAVLSIGFVISTFFCHLGALGLYGLGVIAIELYMNFGDRRVDRRRVLMIDIAVLCLPFAVVPLLMALSPTAQHLGELRWVSSGCVSGGLRCYLFGKARGVRWIFETYSRLSDFVAFSLALLGTLWMVRRRWLRVHPIAAWLAGVAILVYLGLPTEALGSSLIDVRLPVGMAYLMLGFLDFRFPTRKAQFVFICALFGLVLLRVATVLEAWQRYDRNWSDIRASFRHIDRGSKILVARFGASADVNSVESVPCLAVVERSSLESLIFAVPGQQILRVNSPYVENVGGYNDNPPRIDTLTDLQGVMSKMADPGERIYWKNWKDFYDYLYILGTPDHAAPLPDNLELLDSGERYQLYRILR